MPRANRCRYPFELDFPWTRLTCRGGERGEVHGTMPLSRLGMRFARLEPVRSSFFWTRRLLAWTRCNCSTPVLWREWKRVGKCRGKCYRSPRSLNWYLVVESSPSLTTLADVLPLGFRVRVSAVGLSIVHSTSVWSKVLITFPPFGPSYDIPIFPVVSYHRFCLTSPIFQPTNPVTPHSVAKSVSGAPGCWSSPLAQTLSFCTVVPRFQCAVFM